MINEDGRLVFEAAIELLAAAWGRMVQMRLMRVVKRLVRMGANSQAKLIQAALRNLWFEVRTNRIVKKSAGQFHTLAGKTSLKVHLGCGYDIRHGWVNIDLLPSNKTEFNTGPSTDTLLINYDLRRGLPLVTDSCAFIYSSHFFEHLEYKDGLELMRACFVALQPNGVFRMVMPDFRRVFRAYLDGDSEYFSLIGDAALVTRDNARSATIVDYINYAVYQFGEHKCIYDEEKLILLLQNLGYKSVVKSEYKGDLDIDLDLRRRYSFYIEAVK